MCTVNAQKDSLSQTVTLDTATKGQKILMNAGTVYSMWHWYKGSENTNDYREMYHSLKTENRLQHFVQQLQWRCAESRQCCFVIKKSDHCPRMTFCCCQTTTLWTNFFFQKNTRFMRNWRSAVTLHDTETKIALLNLSYCIFVWKEHFIIF